MTKTLPIRFSLVLAAFAFTACLAPDDSDESDESEEVLESEVAIKGGTSEKGSTELGACFHGATTEVVAVDVNAPRCELSQVYDIVLWAETDNQNVLKQFLLEALDGHALIQCRPYVDPKGEDKWCADVVDRYQDDTPLVKGTQPNIDMRNYFVAYTNDEDGNIDKLHWDDLITNNVWAATPIELSETGFILKDGTFVTEYDGSYSSRGERLLKFDPRTCAACGLYEGPGVHADLTGYMHVTNTWGISSGWWPTFDSANCNMQQYYSGGLVHLGGASDLCASEQNYRRTSR